MTENRLLLGTQRLRHRIRRCQKSIQHTKVRRHITEALEADRTSIMPTGKLSKARGVHKVTAAKLLRDSRKREGQRREGGDLNRKTAVEEALSTQGTDAFDASLSASMPFEKTGMHTGVAFHTVIEIHSCTNEHRPSSAVCLSWPYPVLCLDGRRCRKDSGRCLCQGRCRRAGRSHSGTVP